MTRTGHRMCAMCTALDDATKCASTSRGECRCVCHELPASEMTLADRVRSIIFGFPRGDSRRDDIMLIANVVGTLEIEHARLRRLQNEERS